MSANRVRGFIRRLPTGVIPSWALPWAIGYKVPRLLDPAPYQGTIGNFFPKVMGHREIDYLIEEIKKDLAYEREMRYPAPSKWIEASKQLETGEE